MPTPIDPLTQPEQHAPPPTGGGATPDLPDEDLYPDEWRRVDVLTWTVIPAQPGTRIEWKADWCKEGSIPVHAWLVLIDVFGGRNQHTDTSCIIGEPMVLNADDQLQVARHANLSGTPGYIIGPVF